MANLHSAILVTVKTKSCGRCSLKESVDRLIQSNTDYLFFLIWDAREALIVPKTTKK